MLAGMDNVQSLFEDAISGLEISFQAELRAAQRSIREITDSDTLSGMRSHWLGHCFPI